MSWFVPLGVRVPQVGNHCFKVMISSFEVTVGLERESLQLSSTWRKCEQNSGLWKSVEIALRTEFKLVYDGYTVIPRLTKIIRSGITFVSQSVISVGFYRKSFNSFWMLPVPTLVWEEFLSMALWKPLSRMSKRWPSLTFWYTSVI